MRHLRPFRSMLLLTAFAITAPVVARTQSLADVRPGNRVQLTMRDSLRQGPVFPARQIVVGQFVRATADSVWLRPEGASDLSVARHTIKQARVSRGASRLRSALTFGASLGFGFAAAVLVDRIDTGGDRRGEDALIAGGAGLVGGMLVGALSPYEHWRSIRR